MTHNRSVLKLENTEARRGLRQLLKEVQLDDKLKSDPSRLYQRMVESDQFLDSVNDAGTGKVRKKTSSPSLKEASYNMH